MSKVWNQASLRQQTYRNRTVRMVGPVGESWAKREDDVACAYCGYHCCQLVKDGIAYGQCIKKLEIEGFDFEAAREPCDCHVWTYDKACKQCDTTSPERVSKIMRALGWVELNSGAGFKKYCYKHKPDDGIRSWACDDCERTFRCTEDAFKAHDCAGKKAPERPGAKFNFPVEVGITTGQPNSWQWNTRAFSDAFIARYGAFIEPDLMQAPEPIPVDPMPELMRKVYEREPAKRNTLSGLNSVARGEPGLLPEHERAVDESAFYRKLQANAGQQLTINDGQAAACGFGKLTLAERALRDIQAKADALAVEYIANAGEQLNATPAAKRFLEDRKEPWSATRVMSRDVCVKHLGNQEACDCNHSFFLGVDPGMPRDCAMITCFSSQTPRDASTRSVLIHNIMTTGRDESK